MSNEFFRKLEEKTAGHERLYPPLPEGFQYVSGLRALLFGVPDDVLVAVPDDRKKTRREIEDEWEAKSLRVQRHGEVVIYITRRLAKSGLMLRDPEAQEAVALELQRLNLPADFLRDPAKGVPEGFTLPADAKPKADSTLITRKIER